MDAINGTRLDLPAHIRQSIGKILTTPIGTRIMRRDFGSILPDLVDQPMNGRTHLRVMAAAAAAILKWEPRIKPTGVAVLMDAEKLTVTLSATLKSTGEAVSLSGIRIR